MLIWLIKKLFGSYFELSTIFSLTFRVIFSFFLSLFSFLYIGPKCILWLRRMRCFQIVRDYGPKSHYSKRDIPTMGGIILISVTFFSILLCSQINNFYVWYVLFALLGYGVIGFVDDYCKLVKKDNSGLGCFGKYFWQSTIALFLLFIMFVIDNRKISDINLVIPFFKEFSLKLGIWYLLLVYFVIVGSSNAVNLTDGLDGLVIVPIIFILTGIGLTSYIVGDLNFANYLYIPYVEGVKELVVVCAIMIGASLGFLWFNTYPAQIFMGDTGSLSFGAVIGTMAIILRQELLLLVLSGLFVLEALSVIVQVIFFKSFGRRVFLMAPLHHHFELQGCPEPRIIVRFWIISFIFMLLGLINFRIQ
ncbi:phospho-N-acetylmuramoyl-pentapeptide-transferase [Blochmannia endosymbiont of Colobopsis nipponica]|uniref:phospho-N-acetylmuramoyl-pentapeptide- transferase n=1 Tax=Blochmannia endosymbiont of Colobopsis nipponica TaxID=2681987 RepID=UPI00177E4780|nr:phospho-N-acetylmuramoyl-pentapeptide-transferase [Blochmannia endosymbiont of Colobopsis nipponica]QOI11269.1 phospho-N-acetylmuramoyl-pentapeptide-transferase [Blochmannia endosymbiont of Colobopsis nipponica]